MNSDTNNDWIHVVLFLVMCVAGYYGLKLIWFIISSSFFGFLGMIAACFIGFWVFMLSNAPRY